MMSRLVAVGVLLLASPLLLSAQSKSDIQPQANEVKVAKKADIDTWHFHYNSLDEFTSAVMQPSFQLLKSGEAGQMYYLIIRHKNQLVTAAVRKNGGEFSNGSLSVTVFFGEKNILVTPNPDPGPTLVETKVISQEVINQNGLQWSGHSRYRQIVGLAETLKPDYKGKLTVHLERWNEGVDKERSIITEVIDWN